MTFLSVTNPDDCDICFNQYDTNTRRPCIGTCGHSICEACKNQLNSSKCPHCNREDAFEMTTLNHQMLRIVDNLRYSQRTEDSKKSKKTTNFDKMKDELERMYLKTLSPEEKLKRLQNLEEGFCDECGKKAPKIRICVTCAVNQKVLRKIGDRFEVIEYNDAEEANRMLEGVVICKNCALDGVQHVNHKTVQVAKMKIKFADDEVIEKVTQKIEDLEDDATETCETLYALFEEVRGSLNDYFILHETLPPSEKKLHFENVRIQIEEIQETIRIVAKSSKRLEVLEEEITEMKMLFESQRI